MITNNLHRPLARVIVVLVYAHRTIRYFDYKCLSGNDFSVFFAMNVSRRSPCFHSLAPQNIIARHALGQETWRSDLDYNDTETVHLIRIHTSAKIWCLAS